MIMQINRNNYEEFFLLYVDNELPAGERRAVEEFVLLHPDLQEELEILSGSVLTPVDDIVFEYKEELYKKEERRVIAFRWWRMAAAAVILFGLGTFGWMYLNKQTDTQTPAVAEVKEKNRKEPVNQQAAPTPEQRNVIVEPAITKTEKAEVKPVAGQTAKITTRPTEPVKSQNNKNIITEPVEINPESFTSTLADAQEPKEVIDVAVTPRKLDEEINDVAINASYSEPKAQPQPEYVETSDDQIYFANTTVSKRNKLRGVFRKATRILDKVTSLQ
jgi:hypothetical protein